MGSPGKVVRQVTDVERMVLQGSAAHYVQNAKRYRQALRAER
jgi:carbonic anhydrase/acetyltransferase-like protein (isoleucine patch superfamily)